MTTCAIVQSSYIPWRGYFDLIGRSDIFVFLDGVQFTRRDWRTRNYIKTSKGAQLLSVPVKAPKHFELSIRQVPIDSSRDWAGRHLKSIRQAYARAPFREAVLAAIEPIYAHPPELLSELNRRLTLECWSFFSGAAPKRFIGDEELGALPTDDPNGRLIEIAKRAGASRYLSGPSAAAYLDLERWREAGIEVELARYEYAPYAQLFGDFIQAVSIVDTLMCLGPACVEAALARPWPGA